MADYNDITLISEIDETTPAGGEVQSKADDAIRQIKKFLKAFLAVSHQDSGTLKTTAATGAAAGSIRGTTANSGGTQQEIAQGTLATPDLRDGAVATAKLADDAVDAVKLKDDATIDANRAVTSDHIRDSAVTTAKINALAVTTVKLADDAVDATKLKDDAAVDGNRAVTTNHIRDGAVTTDKIAGAAISEAKIANIGNLKLLVGDGAAAKACAVGGAVGLASITGTPGNYVANFTIGGLSSGTAAAYARVIESRSSGTNAGGSTGGSYVQRSSFVEREDSGGIISVSGTQITIATPGTYMVRFWATGYSCGGHRAKLRKVSGTPVDLLVGTSAAAPPGAMTLSQGACVLAISEANTILELHHWCELTVPGNGLGLGIGSGDEEIFAMIELLAVG